MGIPACGGIKLDGATLSTIEGVICTAGTLLIDPTKLITVCGQQWDGDNFGIIRVGGRNIITYCPDGEEPIGGAMVLNANCGVGVDKRFFSLTNKALTLVSGYLLKVNVTPADATISVLNAQSQPVSPISGTTNQFICSGNVSVTVQKDGYQGKSQTINMNANKEVNVTIYPSVELTVHMVVPATADTITVKDADNVTISPKAGTTNVFAVEDTQTYSITTAAAGYNTMITMHTMNGSETVNITMNPEV